MALTPTQVRNNALDNAIIEEQLGVILAIQARAVLTEGAVANAAARLAYAKTVLANPPAAAQAAKWCVLCNPSLNTTLPAALTTAVAADWDLLAGV